MEPGAEFGRSDDRREVGYVRSKVESGWGKLRGSAPTKIRNDGTPRSEGGDEVERFFAKAVHEEEGALI